MKQYLIADSGGTKTDWCLINFAGEKVFFTTESAHPSNWNDAFFVRLTDSLKVIPEIQLTDLYFFGSGCLNDVNRQFLEQKLVDIGFCKVKVKSDLHGAGHALFGKEPGWGAILGTGSVVFKWDGENVVKVIGGKGHLTGDEGSGFYFGKLVYEAYLGSQLNPQQEKTFSRFILEKIGLSQLKIGKNLAEITRDLYPFKIDFKDYHEKNIEIFYETHLKKEAISSLRILGGYAYYHTLILCPFLERKNISVQQVIDKPIVNLVEQIEGFID